MIRIRLKLIYLFFILSVWTISVAAQVPIDSLPSMEADSSYFESSDSSYFQAYNWNGKKIQMPRFYTDSVWNYWNVHQQTIGDRFYFFNSNNGAPARSAYYQLNQEVGWYAGLQQNDLYKLKAEDLIYADSDKTLAQLSYNQGGLQANSQTNVLFATSFADHALLSLQYNRNHEAGFYPQQKTRTTSIGAGLVVHANDRLSFNLQAISNNIIQQENGGISDSSLYNSSIYSDRSVYPVNFSDANLDDRARDFLFRMSYQLLSDAGADRGLSIGLAARRSLRNYLYNDLSSSIDSSAYKGYLNSRGNAHLGLTDRQWVFGGFSQWKYMLGDLRPGQVDVALNYHAHKIHNDQQAYDLNQLILKTKWRQDLSEDLRVRAVFDALFLDQGGDYKFEAGGKLKLFDQAALGFSFLNQRKHPSYVQDQLYNLDQQLYLNGFEPVLSTVVAGQVGFEKYGLDLHLSQTWVDRFIYFDRNYAFVQTDANQSIFQARLRFKTKIGILFTDNDFYFQNASSKQFLVPNFISKNYLGIKTKIIRKRLGLDLGIESYIIPELLRSGYFPLSGQYYLLEGNSPYGYDLNGILGLKIKRFDILFRFNHLQKLWKNELQEFVHNYPIYDFNFRFGLRWQIRG